ncbi:MAG: hypothetical protein CVV23_02415 [Ignavibacteriae bacterium HGW-Ignavibacteriae-2]|jgi:predicted RNA-binding protein with PIN domain|nr:MAG: hypothetical protein CVV23_02415 [Ignavibacteriae bacterium HGW-Ignavibacteriae-2]
MIKHYIIDGNNLLGKLKKYSEFKKVGKVDGRSKLAFVIERYFIKKLFSVTLHFDGYKSDPIKTTKVRIDYSENKTADYWIKHEIMVIKNPKTICVVTSDMNIVEFAKKSSCKIISSEKFAEELLKKNTGTEEEKRIKTIDDDEIKKLFGV